MLFKCKLRNCATRAAGFFPAWTVGTGLRATGTASPRAAMAAPSTPSTGRALRAPAPIGSRKHPAAFLSRVPLPWQPGRRARRGRESITTGLRRRRGPHSAPPPRASPSIHTSSRRFCLRQQHMPAGHACAHARTQADTHSHTHSHNLLSATCLTQLS